MNLVFLEILLDFGTSNKFRIWIINKNSPHFFPKLILRFFLTLIFDICNSLLNILIYVFCKPYFIICGRICIKNIAIFMNWVCLSLILLIFIIWKVYIIYAYELFVSSSWILTYIHIIFKVLIIIIIFYFHFFCYSKMI